MTIEKKAPMILGIGATLAGVFLLFRKKKPSLPEPPEGGVLIVLLNPPSEATMWQLVLCDWDITTAIRPIGGLARLDITEPMAFEIPSGLKFPLRIVLLQITKWNEAKTALVGLYEIQSYRPYLWDFDKMEWSDEPDPRYREVFIPAPGSYYYNVAKERFEQ